MFFQASKLLSIDKRILLCLFPFMLSKSSERKNIKENTSMHETQYLKNLDRYISYVTRNDLYQTEIVPSFVNDIMHQHMI